MGLIVKYKLEIDMCHGSVLPRVEFGNGFKVALVVSCIVLLNHIIHTFNGDLLWV